MLEMDEQRWNIVREQSVLFVLCRRQWRSGARVRLSIELQE